MEFTQLYKKTDVSMELKLFKKLGNYYPFDRSACNLLVFEKEKLEFFG